MPGDAPYNIFGGPGYCAVTSPTSTIACANSGSDGSTPAEQFIPYSPTGSNIILPGDGVIWASNQTGMYCRVINTPTSLLTIACDQSSPSSASSFTYTGSTIYFEGRPLIVPADGSTPYFAPPGSSPVVKPTPITPATQPEGPAITPNEPYTIFGGPGYCQVASATSYLTCCNLTANGNSSQEHFIPSSPDGSLLSILPGQPVLWQSAATKRYCRLVRQASGADYIRCDQPSADTATVFTYSGRAGFSFNDRPLTVPQDCTPAYVPSFPQPPARPVPIDPGLPPTMAPTTCSSQEVLIATTAPGGPSTATSASGITSLWLQPVGKELSVVMSCAAHTNDTVIGPVPSSRCNKPYQLVLLPDGNIVLRDSEGRVMWSSQTACLGLCKCYTYAISDLPGLQLRCAGSNRVVWSTDAHSNAANRAHRSTRQLSSRAALSYSTNAGRCIGTAAAPSVLYSYSQRYSLRPTTSGALGLMDTTTKQLLWSPRVAVASARSARPYQLCLDTRGQLLLQPGAQGAAALWRSAPAAAAAAAAAVAVAPAGRGYYTALIDEATGSLAVVTSTCQKVFASNAADAAAPEGSAASGAWTPPRRRPPASASSRSPPRSMAAVGLVTIPAAAGRRPPPRAQAPPRSPSAAAKRAPPQLGSGSNAAGLATLPNRAQALPGNQTVAPNRAVSLLRGFGPASQGKKPKSPPKALKPPKAPKPPSAPRLPAFARKSAPSTQAPTATNAGPRLQQPALHTALPSFADATPPKAPARTRPPPRPRSGAAASLGSKAAGAGAASMPPPLPGLLAPASNASATIMPIAACSAGVRRLGEMDVCGGITLCGADAPCTSLGCCSPGLACTRSSEFVWLCTP